MSRTSLEALSTAAWICRKIMEVFFAPANGLQVLVAQADCFNQCLALLDVGVYRRPAATRFPGRLDVI